jgi:sterol desaturase/sphingolipid hydroxylase (fatty acid hydroxylase superfamily)
VLENLLCHKGVTFLWAFLFDKIPSTIIRTNTWVNFLGIYTFLFLLTDISVYVTHRVLHTRWFYKEHKTHHTYIHAEPLGAIYESKFEMLVGSPLLSMIVYRNLAMSTVEIITMSVIYALNSLRIHSGVSWSVSITDWVSTAKKW